MRDEASVDDYRPRQDMRDYSNPRNISKLFSKANKKGGALDKENFRNAKTCNDMYGAFDKGKPPAF